MSDGASVLVDVADSVATVTLNRPDTLNAIDDAIRRDLPGVVDRLADDRSVRVVVFTGAGRAFSAGGSVDHFEKEMSPEEFLAGSHRLSAVYDAIEAMEKPVIAALNGVATGAGLQLALACDLRFAAESARVGYREHRLGLIPAHGGATRLVKLLGLSRAKELYFRGDLVDAAEAHRLGLVHRVLPDAELAGAVAEEARRLARRAPVALGLAKRLLNAAADIDTASGIVLESEAQGIARRTKDHQEGVRAFREKRRPEFRGE
jgi:enoyl-CoA hydratase/carnithine racemase